MSAFGSDVQVITELQLRREAMRDELQRAKEEVRQWTADVGSMRVVVPVTGKDELGPYVDKLIADIQSTRRIVIPVVGDASGGSGFAGNAVAAAGATPVGSTPMGIAAAQGLKDEYTGYLTAARTSSGLNRTQRDQMELLRSAAAGFSARGAEMPEGLASELALMQSTALAASGAYADPRTVRGESIRGRAEFHARNQLAQAEAAEQRFRASIAAGGSLGAPPTLADIDEAAEYERYQVRGASAEDTAAAMGARTREKWRSRRGSSGQFGMVRGMALMHTAFQGIEGISQAISDRNTDFEDEAGPDPSAQARAMIRQLKQEKSIFFGLPSKIRDIGTYYLENGQTSDETIDEMQASIRHDQAVRQQGKYAAELGAGVTRFDDRVSFMRDALAQADAPTRPDQKIAQVHKETDKLIRGFEEEGHKLEELAGKITNVGQRQQMVRRIEADVSQSKSLALGAETADIKRIRLDEEQEGYRQQFVQDAEMARAGSMAARNRAGRLSLAGNRLAAEGVLIDDQTMQQKEALAERFRKGELTDQSYLRQFREIDTAGQISKAEAGVRDKLRDLGEEALTDKANELGTVSPYARDRQAIQDEMRREMRAARLHKNDVLARRSETLGNARLHDLDRRHGLEMTALTQQGDLMRLAAEGRPELAEVMGLGNEMKDQLAAAEGDPEMQSAIRGNFRGRSAMLRRRLTQPHARMTDMVSIYWEQQARIFEDPKGLSARDHHDAVEGLDTFDRGLNFAQGRGRTGVGTTSAKNAAEVVQLAHEVLISFGKAVDKLAGWASLHMR